MIKYEVDTEAELSAVIDNVDTGEMVIFGLDTYVKRSDKTFQAVGLKTPSYTSIVSASNAISIDWNNESNKYWILTVGENTTISFLNGDNRKEGVAIISVTGSDRSIIFPSTVKFSSSTVGAISGASWTTGTKTLLLPVGVYKIGMHFDGVSDLIDLAGGDYS